MNALDPVSISASPPPPDVDTVQRNLSVLTPVGRQAFLLVVMEELTLEETALVLDMSSEEVNSLLEDANQDISTQLATDCGHHRR